MLYVPISSCTGHAYADPHVTVGRTPESHVRQNNAHALGRPAEHMGRPCMQKVPEVSFLFALCSLIDQEIEGVNFQKTFCLNLCAIKIYPNLLTSHPKFSIKIKLNKN
jgi:hypothetical protein